MTYEQKDNSGSLFKNTRRETDDHPHMTGKSLIRCAACGERIPYWTSAWTKPEDKQGNRWQSLSFKPVDGLAKSPGTPLHEELDESIPF